MAHKPTKSELAQLKAELKAELERTSAELAKLTTELTTELGSNGTQTSFEELLCAGFLRRLPVGDIAALQQCSRGCRGQLAASSLWRQLYSLDFPHELPKSEGVVQHPLDADVWRRLYLERRLDGEVTVPCVLLSPASMAAATLDPGAIRLIEAYLRRLTQQIAAMFGRLLSPPEEPGLREAALSECARLVASCDAPTARAAKMVLLQLETTAKGTGLCSGSEGPTCWCFDTELAQLRKRHRCASGKRGSGEGGTRVWLPTGVGDRAARASWTRSPHTALHFCREPHSREPHSCRPQ